MASDNKRLLPIAAIVLLQLVAVYALVLNLQRELAAQFGRNAQVTLDDLAESVIDRTRRFLRPVHDAVGIGVEFIDQGVLDGDDDASLEIYFEAQLAATPWLSGLFLGRTDGSFVYLARNEFGLRTKRITVVDGVRVVELVQRDSGGVVTERWIDADDDYDPRERSWYRAARVSESIAWTDPYRFFSSGLPGISAAARSRTGSILGADVELQELSAFIDRIPHAESGTALIVDNARRVIARSGAEDASADTATNEIPAFADIAEPPLQALQAAHERGGANDALVELDVDSVTFLGLARAFPIAEDAESWTLLVQMRADDYAGGALNLFNRQIMLLGVISIGLGALALGGILWMHRLGRQADLGTSRDPTSGALREERFAKLMHERLGPKQRRQDRCDGVMVVEALGLRRLADRLGTSCRDAVVVEIGRRLGSVLDDGDLLGISPNRRYVVAVHADSRATLLERFDRLHQAVVNDPTFQTPCGAQQLTIASGVAVLDGAESVANLLPRAREALTLGIDNERSGYQLAVGLDAHDLNVSDRGA